ncbi:MAG TPA: glycosyltransferase, partial [Cycloclasticus sp.]|nr:glycosyltransferase [Cycloclasticus sp.]
MADISIIIPTLNEEGVLGGTLQSLKVIQRQGAEVIIVDGGSVDATLDIAKQFAVQVIQAD